MAGVLPFSWSSLESYDTCPRAYYEIKIAKNYKEDQNKDYLLWGNAVHTAMELRVRDAVPLPENMKQWEGLASRLANAPGKIICEGETAITADLKPTGYWDADCWNRGKDDVVIINGPNAVNIDYKTGKPKTKVTRQLELSSLRVFIKYPEVEKISAAFAWMSNNTWSRAVYTREDIPAIAKHFEGAVGNMLWSQEKNAWPAKPSGLCRKSRKPGSTYGGCIVASCPHSEFYKR